jgi:pseudouridine-5'-phosphate glycosidase
MVRYELKDFDVLENKIRLVKKEFPEFFNRKSNEREVLMIEIIENLMEKDSIRKEKALLAKAKSLILTPGRKETEDADILNYRNWLGDKLK